MDIFCSLCGATDGASPDDHDCLGNKTELIENAWKKFNPQGLQDHSSLGESTILAWERYVSELYEKLRDLTVWYSERVDEAERKYTSVYNQKQLARRKLTDLRAEVREIMADPE